MLNKHNYKTARWPWSLGQKKKKKKKDWNDSLTWNSLRRARGSRRGRREGVTVRVWGIDLHTQVFLDDYIQLNILNVMFHRKTKNVTFYDYLRMPKLFQSHHLNFQVQLHGWLLRRGEKKQTFQSERVSGLGLSRVTMLHDIIAQ